MSDVPKCPYNSIYSTVKSRNEDEKKPVMCCEHGKPCIYGQATKKKDETAQYVNLMKEDEQEKALLSEGKTDKLKELAMRLREVEEKSAKNQKKQEKKKRKDKQKSEGRTKERELVKMGKIVNDESDLTFIEESRGRIDGKDLEVEELSHVLAKLGASTESSISQKKSKNKKTVEDRSQCSVSKSEKRRQKKLKSSQMSGQSAPRKEKYAEEGALAKSVYLGAITTSAAEASLENQSDFRIYHKMKKHVDLDDLPATIKLYLVCKNDSGFRHYQIRQATSPAGNKKLYIERREKESMFFKNLDELVSYYNGQARIRAEECPL